MRLTREEAKARLRNAMELIRAAKSCGDHMDPSIELECALDQIQLVVESIEEKASGAQS